MQTVTFRAEDIDPPAATAPSGPVTFRAEDIDRPPDFTTTNEPPSDAMQQEAADPNTVATYARHIWQTLNPVQLGQMLPFPKALGGSGLDNPLLPKNILAQMHAVKQEADARWEKGDKVGAAAKYTESLIPILGPMMSHAGNQAQRGEWAALAGDVTGAVAVPELLQRVPATRTTVRPVVRAHLTPEEAAAVKFGEARGVPIDAATATGNAFVRGIQKVTGESLGGSVVGGRARSAQQQALTRTGKQLATGPLASASSPELAGRTLVGALEDKIQAHQDWANTQYDALRAIEADPKYSRQVRVATSATGGVPATVQMPLPIDLRGAKQTLTPIYQQLERQSPLTRQQSSAGFKALQNIVQGPDYAPLSQVDRDLSALKDIAREQGGVAKLAVQEVDAAVRKRAAQAGPAAAHALELGREAVKARVATSDLLESIRSEPVQAYRQMVAPQDTGIDLLRTVQKETPHAIPGVARAYLDEAMRTATAEGGFGHAAKLQADWRRLGASTKRILFPLPGQVEALDNFFLLAKRIAENPNPSGTAGTAFKGGELLGLITNPLVGVPVSAASTAMAALLYSPAGVRALTRGLSIAVSPAKYSTAAQAAAVANIVKAAQEAGVTLPLAKAARLENPPATTSPQ